MMMMMMMWKGLRVLYTTMNDGIMMMDHEAHNPALVVGWCGVVEQVDLFECCLYSNL